MLFQPMQDHQAQILEVDLAVAIHIPGDNDLTDRLPKARFAHLSRPAGDYTVSDRRAGIAVCITMNCAGRIEAGPRRASKAIVSSVIVGYRKPAKFTIGIPSKSDKSKTNIIICLEKFTPFTIIQHSLLSS